MPMQVMVGSGGNGKTRTAMHRADWVRENVAKRKKEVLVLGEETRKLRVLVLRRFRVWFLYWYFTAFFLFLVSSGSIWAIIYGVLQIVRSVLNDNQYSIKAPLASM
ncbi:hypothetical protein ASPWEDRAFT_35770 [Aspergillus wentii DTO 134E9]|uniref:Uncharacterized protein n=1 Tax=Aspergillus wentii DTO 134E9 TaxID=1073089 RepID=A0A1L9RTF7_ASPWE|nr:uncharacterized protein ASPWEDRAFT_35770 [Aspergillus wentii DTO 134E9]OJJ38184.1 hypothetical protein ASPWEDRAFT_35770 [Aspergillus wentii DTO 134E9]